MYCIYDEVLRPRPPLTSRLPIPGCSVSCWAGVAVRVVALDPIPRPARAAHALVVLAVRAELHRELARRLRVALRTPPALSNARPAACYSPARCADSCRARSRSSPGPARPSTATRARTRAPCRRRGRTARLPPRTWWSRNIFKPSCKYFLLWC